MLSVLMTLHLLGVIVWVGGMFFAHMALRPAATELLEPPQRLPLLRATLTHFFRWVWLAVIFILLSGYGLLFGLFHGQVGIYVHVMQLLGLVMTGLFLFIYFVPFPRLCRFLDGGDVPAAGAQMAVIRRIIGLNLVLGLLSTIVATSKLF